MTNLIFKKKARWIVIACFIGPVFPSGCSRISRESAGAQHELLGSLTQPVRVSLINTDAAEPAIAALSDGSVYVVWVTHSPESKADIMIARFTDDGKMQGPPVRVNTESGMATAWRGDPPTIAIAPDQTVFVGWTSRVDDESKHATNLYLSSSPDQARSFSAPVKVNDDTGPVVHGMHSLGIGADGRIYVAWLDERNIKPMKDTMMDSKSAGHHMESNRDVFMSFSTDGGRSFAPNKLIVANACPCCKTTLAVGVDQRVYLSWRQVLPQDFRHIALSFSIDGGETFSRPVIVSDDKWELKGCPVTGAALSPQRDGSLRVLWYAAGEEVEPGIYWAESRDGGRTFSTRTLLAVTSSRGTPSLAARSGDEESWAVWEASKSGKTMVTAAKLGNQSPTQTAILADGGELPVAAATDQIHVAYILEQGEMRSVWLVTSSVNF